MRKRFDPPSIDELAALAAFASKELLQLTLAERYPKFIPDYRPNVMAALAPHLPDELLPQALRISQAIPDLLGQAVALASLSAMIDPKQTEHVAMLAFTLAQRTDPLNDSSRRPVLEDNMPQHLLPESTLLRRFPPQDMKSQRPRQ